MMRLLQLSKHPKIRTIGCRKMREKGYVRRMNPDLRVYLRAISSRLHVTIVQRGEAARLVVRMTQAVCRALWRARLERMHVAACWDARVAPAENSSREVCLTSFRSHSRVLK